MKEKDMMIYHQHTDEAAFKVVIEYYSNNSDKPTKTYYVDEPQIERVFKFVNTVIKEDGLSVTRVTIESVN